MKVSEVKEKAEELGIKCGKMKKAELIHSIQEAECNMTCYGRSNGTCEYTDCCFMDDCLKVKC